LPAILAAKPERAKEALDCASPLPHPRLRRFSVFSDLPTEGRLEGGRHLLPVRVYFEDTDLSGIVYHANYLRYMERGRTEMLRAAGISHSDTLASGTGYYAVHAMNLIWHRPAKLDDALVVESTVMNVRAAATVMRQRVLRGDDCLCSADVTAAFLGMDGRPRRQGKIWHDLFTSLMQQAATN
jgi:acyl-CoA thioester hydrolase